MVFLISRSPSIRVLPLMRSLSVAFGFAAIPIFPLLPILIRVAPLVPRMMSSLAMRERFVAAPIHAFALMSPLKRETQSTRSLAEL